MNTLENIGKISIPRNVVNQDLNDPIDLIELHGFSDARFVKFEKITDISKRFFCDTKSNPADSLTRPKVHENFQNNLFWWKCATFLHENVSAFKEFNLLDPNHEGVSTEIKSAVLLTKVHTTEFNVESVIKIGRYDSLLELFRKTAWIFKFVKNLKN